jgi:hypothetical protein
MGKDFDPTVDNEAVYDKQVSPLMRQIIAICQENGMPFTATFQFSGDDQVSSGYIPENTPRHSPLRAIGTILRPTLDPLPAQVLGEDAEGVEVEVAPLGDLWNLASYWIKSAEGQITDDGNYLRIVATLIELAAVMVHSSPLNTDDAEDGFLDLARRLFGRARDIAAALVARHTGEAR